MLANYIFLEIGLFNFLSLSGTQNPIFFKFILYKVFSNDICLRNMSLYSEHIACEKILKSLKHLKK